jgi:hypothetical protein
MDVGLGRPLAALSLQLCNQLSEFDHLGQKHSQHVPKAIVSLRLSDASNDFPSILYSMRDSICDRTS